MRIQIKKEKISARDKEKDRNMMPRAGTWHSTTVLMMGPVITLLILISLLSIFGFSMQLSFVSSL